MSRPWVWRAVALVAALGCVAWLAASFGGELLAARHRMQLTRLPVYLLVALLVRCGYVVRWAAIAHALHTRCSFIKLTVARLVSDAVANVSPAGRFSSDPLRVVLVAEGTVRTSRLAAGVALDRVVETIGNSIAALSYIVAFWLAQSGERPALVGLAIALGGGLLAIVVALAALRHGYRPFAPLYWIAGRVRTRWMRVVLIGARRTERHVRDLLRLQPGLAMVAIAGSLLIEVLIVVEHRLFFSVFGVDVSWTMVMMSLLVGGVSRAVPTPGGLGAFEAGQVAVFGAAIGRPEVGFAVGILMRLNDLLWGMIALLAVIGSGVPLSRLRSRSTAGKAAMA